MFELLLTKNYFLDAGGKFNVNKMCRTRPSPGRLLYIVCTLILRSDPGETELNQESRRETFVLTKMSLKPIKS